ncbi:d1dd60ed-c7ba-4f40-949d-cdcd26a90bb3 [Thermothielavioides terrestris]|uniref:D1dd60ed-c7ba-4f40-949d-cdcd26a90bb3 n=1 Tax=Thermothielavioides terrestris TaxID=2587410 RepID=A0A446B9M9_9PEZI|nr:d1dd60ed-c7ba-4f40-949d-cdcd26a90bb3 [Thermothielavioides terrestris]
MARISPTTSANAVEAAAAPSKTPSPGRGTSSTMTPFAGLPQGLNFNEDLEVVIAEKQTRKMLRAKQGKKQYLPGQPRVRLEGTEHNADANTDGLLEYLRESHSTAELDDLLPLMRYIFVQTPSYKHIMPLHHQKSHARDLKVTEHPGLHLVWYYELIFVKPVPAYFYSPAFWEYLENADQGLYRACLGFMRSYYLLIKYEIDFELARELRLIPRKADGEYPTYEEWCSFIEPFGQVGDHWVNRRYHYGELRLTRINRAAFLFRGSLAYFHIYPQWGSFLEHTLAPLLTLFAVCSVVLNSMQVSLAALVMADSPPAGRWSHFVDASVWFPIVVMLAIAAVLAAAVVGITLMGFKDLFRANYVRHRRKNGDADAGTRTHGMVW